MTRVFRTPFEVDGSVWAVAALAALIASLGLIGGDALWLVPLGHEIAHGHLPGSISFATAPTSGWHDVPALAEFLFWGLYRIFGGDRGLLVAQMLGAAVGFGALARGLARETTGGAVIVLCAIVMAGALPAVVIVSVSAFSLALFPVTLALLESESRARSRRIWLAVPLIALWGNLHGGVIAGWGLLACYLVFDRARHDRRTAALVLGSATLALFLNPALWRTPLYYRGIFESQVARRGLELWAPLSGRGVDLLAIVVALVLALIGLSRRAHVSLWEVVAVAGLIAATIDVARNGTWLLFIVAYPAARSLRIGAPKERLLVLAAAIVALGAVAGIARGPVDPGARSLARIVARTHEPVLATALLGQQVAADGGRVWVNNPIDAFRQSDQRLWLDWLHLDPSGSAAVRHVVQVLVPTGSGLDHLAADDPRLSFVLEGGGASLYRVVPKTPN
ncbi:MAG TPA: hypothetical protein VGM80_01425 [Gaiellaceae bacterium]